MNDAPNDDNESIPDGAGGGEAQPETGHQPPSGPRLLSRMLTTEGAVSRGQYLRVGFALMALKFAVEAALGYTLNGAWPSPTVYFMPVLQLRNALLGPDPTPAMVLGLVAWTLPFAWIGAAMSVRRARDAGLPAWVGLGFLLPFLNYLFIAMLAAMPARARSHATGTADGEPSAPHRADHDHGIAAALKGVFAGAALSLLFVGIAASGFGSYGGTVFLGAPFLMGAIAGFIYCRQAPRSESSVLAVGVVTQLLAGLLLLLFAAEGVICLAMAMPLACAAGAMGALIGKAIAGTPTQSWQRALGVPLLVLPLAVVGQPPAAALRMVETRVVVNAPPARVWDIVVAFPEIPADADNTWLFRAGVAMPLRARIDGQGVGAVRHCEFTTGAFVEPITVWNPPTHLAFDVSEQPAPMTEMSFWRHVHAPHLVDQTLHSERDEFRLKALAGGRTELIGRTWYRINMGPEAYWGVWVDTIVHQVHQRVLRHIARVAATR